VLSQAQTGAFAADGFAAGRRAVPPDVLRACQQEIWSALGDRSVLRHDPSAWRDPVLCSSGPASEASAAADTQLVSSEAPGQLISEGRWWRRCGVGGPIPVRFPGQADPWDTGWHIEAGIGKGRDWWVNYRSRPPGAARLTPQHGRFAPRNQLRGVRRRERTWVIRSALACRR
jgi:hypothetical protein